MAKIIKKNFMKSLPIFLIVSLLSLSVAGLVFNFNIEISKIGDKLGLSVELPEAEANNDVATTTVTVQNAPPSFSVQPAESPASASTTPVNVGGSVTFIATANDAEANDYYLLVCDIDGATPGAGGTAPSCTGASAKQFCVSNAASSTVQATCSYTVEASIVSETQDWVAYVCDNHSSEPACITTSSSGGGGDASSPFHVNHAPLFSEVNTTLDNQVPGGDFTFTASTTDSDIVGGVDVLTLYVCDTNSWTIAGCDGTQLCTATSTSPNVSCTWTSAAPLRDQAYNYYAFVKDDNDLASNGNSQTSTYTVANAPPSVSSVLLNNGAPITLNIKGNTTTVYASSTSITDPNSCMDIVSATSTVYWSNASAGPNCAADDNDCYQITSGSCILDAASCTGWDDSDINIQCTTDLEYYAIPTVAGDNNSNGGTTWLASIRAFDEVASYASSSPGIDLNVTTAIEVTDTEIAYGSLIAGTDTGSTNATTTIVNAGNSPLNTNLQGEDMLRNGTGPEVILASQQQFNLGNFSYGAATSTALANIDTLVDTTISRPTSITNVEDDIFWGIGVPVILSGDYSGLNTFTAALDVSAPTEW